MKKASTIAERVAAGATFLDEREPGWWRRIDVDRLSISDSCNCILGQLAGGFGDGMDQYDVWSAGGIADVDMGFYWGIVPDDIDDLTFEWRRLITERRETAVPA